MHKLLAYERKRATWNLLRFFFSKKKEMKQNLSVRLSLFTSALNFINFECFLDISKAITMTNSELMTYSTIFKFSVFQKNSLKKFVFKT